MLETFHSNIKFTYEEEVNNTLPFLDVLLLETRITFIQLYIEKKPTRIYTYIDINLHLYLGNVEHSELWLAEPILSAPTIIIYSKS